MSGVDRSPAAVARRLEAALVLGAGARAAAAAKGVRRDGAAVAARLRRVGELRRLALRLAAGGEARSEGCPPPV